MSETVAPPAAAITEAQVATRPKPAANTAHKCQISEAIPRNERPIARQARPESVEGDARGGVVREVPKEMLPQALLSDAVAVCASPKNAVEGHNL
jgi:hypothetical protein